MHCPHCKTDNSTVIDTTPSHKVYFKGRSKSYLYNSGLSIVKDIWPKISESIDIKLPIDDMDVPYVARAIRCKNCGHKYRTIEIIIKQYT